MQKQHIWIHESKCGELYSISALIHDFYLPQRRYQSRDCKSLTLSHSPSDPDGLRSKAETKFSYTWGDEKGRERAWRWYARPICVEDQPWQHYSSSSIPTPSYSITSRTSSLNPITADQCCLFHSCREMICLKVTFPQHILRVKLAPFFTVRLYIGAAEDDP